MSNKPQLSLAERAKDFLQVDGEHSLFELEALLRECRKNTHPDKFQDPDLKKKAETRFKDAQVLLDECSKQMEVQRFNHKPAELTLYKPLYDSIELQRELDEVKKELTEAKIDLKPKIEKIRELTEEVQRKKDDSLSSEIQHLQTLYRPSSRNYASIGLAMVLSGALGVMTQMEKVSGVLEKYSPFEGKYISTILFACMIFFLVAMIRKMWEREYVSRKSEEVCSPRNTDCFIEYLKIKRPSDAEISTFSEVEVFNFLSSRNIWFKRTAKLLGFQIFSPKTVNRLKDIFIHNLLNKKLIAFSKAEKMQRNFKVVNTSDMSDFWHEQYRKEKTKNEAHEDTEVPF